MPSVAVVILSWNRRAAVLDCIERVTRQTVSTRIIVVDNASSDGSPDAIRNGHPEVTVLENPTNAGFVGGVNRGLAEARRIGVGHAWLLNDDTQFEDDALERLLDHASRQLSPGLASPRIDDLDGHGALQFANGLIDMTDAILKHNYSAASFDARRSHGSIPIVPGTAMLCDLRVYRAIGPFDPRFFAYWEDTDYCARAARAGFGIDVAADVAIRHESRGGRHGRAPHFCYYMVRNEALFVRLHVRGWTGWRWRRRWLADTLEWIAEARALRLDGNVDACIDGLWDALLHRYGTRGDHRPAPGWFRRTLSTAPYLLCDLVGGRYARVARRLVGSGSRT